MKFEELKPKYQDLEIYIEKENLSLLQIPQLMKYDFALNMYKDRKVLFITDHDDRKKTEVILESEENCNKRKKYES